MKKIINALMLPTLSNSHLIHRTLIPPDVSLPVVLTYLLDICGDARRRSRRKMSSAGAECADADGYGRTTDKDTRDTTWCRRDSDSSCQEVMWRRGALIRVIVWVITVTIAAPQPQRSFHLHITNHTT